MRVTRPSDCRFGGVEEAAGEEQILRPRRPDEIDEARVVRRRQAVAERARDRHAEARVGRADAQVAGSAIAQPPPAATPCDLRDRRHWHALEPVDARRRAAARTRAPSSPDLEVGELADVGAGDERLAARRG